MNAHLRRPAVALAVMTALCALPVSAADYSSGSSQSTMSGSPEKSSAASSHERMSTRNSSAGSMHQKEANASANVGEAMDLMVQADSNKDGIVTKDEVQKLDPSLAAHFDEADTNHDGKLTLKEFQKLLASREGASRVGGTSGRAPTSTTGSRKSSDTSMRR